MNIKKVVTGAMAVVMGLFGSGCMTRLTIPTRELANLDGYDIHNERSVTVVTGTAMYGSRGMPTMARVPVTDRPYRLITNEGDAVDFTSRTLLGLVTAGQPEERNRYREVHVTDTTFQGITRNGQSIEVPLTSIDEASVTTVSIGKTLGLAFGIAGAVLVASAVTTIVLISSMH
jgi:hypothetical protein